MVLLKPEAATQEQIFEALLLVAGAMADLNYLRRAFVELKPA
jgi:hypothetical protein